uniref:Uncharacterized protein n=1 Tax=Myoviridae sp. ctCo31 TaxID=2825053 RepID=A0A8S5UMJ5_9CAUD|nr:MAG TPA: hypothetical protein [Myoviridae sp. ctCo31]
MDCLSWPMVKSSSIPKFIQCYWIYLWRWR